MNDEVKDLSMTNNKRRISKIGKTFSIGSFSNKVSNNGEIHINMNIQK